MKAPISAIVRLLPLLAAAISLGWVSFSEGPVGPTPLWSVNLPGRWSLQPAEGSGIERAVVIVEPDGSDGFYVRRESAEKTKRSFSKGWRFRLSHVAGRDCIVMMDMGGPVFLRAAWNAATRSVQLECVDGGKITALVEIGALRVRKFGERTHILDRRAVIEPMLADGTISFVPCGRVERIDP